MTGTGTTNKEVVEVNRNALAGSGEGMGEESENTLTEMTTEMAINLT